MAYKISFSNLEKLFNKLNTIENINNAKEYIKSRKLDSSNFKYTPYLSSDLSTFVKINSEIYKEDWLSDSLFFPIVDIDKNLIGFDVRYLGQNEERIRYYKLKESSASLFNYNSSSILEKAEYLFVCEGVIDLESLSYCIKDSYFSEYSLISPLTCLTNFKYLELLLMCKKQIVICYDNDSAGIKAKEKIKTFCKENKISNINYLNYLGKDINESLIRYGKEYLINQVNSLFNSINIKKNLKIYE